MGTQENEQVPGENQGLEQVPEINEDDYSPLEKKAIDSGWKPKDKFDGDEEEFISAREFIKNGELIGEIRNLRGELKQQSSSFETRLQNVNLLHQQQLNTELTSLKKQQRQAAEAADVEKFDDLSKQIEDVHVKASQTVAPQQGNSDPLGQDPDMQNWRQKNPWIKDGTQPAKRIYAENLCAAYIQNNPSHSVAQMLGAVDQEISRQFPQSQNQNREKPSMSDQGKQTNQSRSTGKLSMKNLNEQEKKIWQQMGKAWKDEKSFLKACEDARKG